MGTRIERHFTVKAPPDRVWAFLVDPHRVIHCLPGAELQEVIDDRTFRGSVKVKLGPATVAYQGRVRLVELDEGGRRVKMTGEGREGGGAGAAKMTMESHLSEVSDGTEVAIAAEMDVAGRMMQLGRGMIEQVSKQLFDQFAACVKATLEVPAGAEPGAATAAPPGPAKPVHIVPLVLAALWALLTRLVERLLPGKRGDE
ncbi:MAG TPA: SRPBCC family protein [Anaeromyxobacteraceae bacterium]|nr:SRPBCC family protein [Anaeromyxobacteraceae bacterium]